MPFIITPGQLTQRAEFYHQLGQLTGAGIGLPAALQQLHRNPPNRSYRRPVGQLLEMLTDGYTFAESLQRLGSWVPAFDIALLHAGEHSGRLDACLKLLADYYTDRARIARQMIADLIYPVFLFHFGVLIFTFLKLIRTTGWIGPLAQMLGILLPIYALVLLIIYAAQSRHGERWRGRLEGLLRPMPVLGTARRYLALSRLSAALEALLRAGVTILEAWELAATASGSPALRRIVLAWRPLVDAGQTPAEVVTASGKFPEMFAHQYTTGEISGQLDDTLHRLHQYYQEEGSRKLHLVTQWVPRAVYLVVMLLIAYQIVQFYAGYFRDVGAAGGF
ncbi:MAG TPA: type II secretion system F family protein [Candidatus Acidoferrum sp.]|jgi:type II secretory pathway component PulF|nr:type II secretion system F family protein [Candidatus Acidoferrum sp.]